MLERIKKIMELEGLSSSQFADEINIQRSSMSHVLSGRNKPSLDFILKIKNSFDRIRLDWLLLGSGNMFDKVEEPLNIATIEDETGENPTLNFDISPKSDEIVMNEVQNGITDEDVSELKEKSILSSSVTSKIVIFYTNGTFEEFRKV